MDILDGQTAEMQGSGRNPYILKNVGGVYSCSCPAWRNQSAPIERRTCKHLKKYRGEQIEMARVGGVVTPVSKTAQEKKAAKEEKAKDAPVLLAHVWENDIDLDGWWISEKLDGVRAYWDGTQLLSRNGNRYYAPDWFIAGLPKEPLDGELWLARKSFQVTSGIVRRQDGSGEWNRIKYRLFDAPSQKMPFEQRMKYLYELALPKTTEVLGQMRCKGLAHLQDELNKAEALGAEGLMLREPGSFYEAGRSHTLLKVKKFYDAEATIMDYEKGKGKYKNMVGSLVCMANGPIPVKGVAFKVGTGLTDELRRNPPRIGATITFRYQELTDGGNPRFPAYVR